jgi:hypothetical protein
MERASQHTFQVLTKRPKRMRQHRQRPGLEGGCERDARHRAAERVARHVDRERRLRARDADYLRETPAAVRFISAEPLLGPLPSLDLTGIDWLIVGGESGPNARPMEAEWVRDLQRRLLQETGTAFFFKQWGGRTPKSGGRELDGRTWDEMPWSDEICLGLPQMRRWNDGIHCSTVLWVKVEGSDQIARAARFRPLPTVAIQEGSSSRRWLLWLLERPVDYFQVRDRNRRLAYHLRAVQKAGSPDNAWFPAPGSFLRYGRSRPAPVVCSRLTTASFEPDAITSRLREPPPADAWMGKAT